MDQSPIAWFLRLGVLAYIICLGIVFSDINGPQSQGVIAYLSFFWPAAIGVAMAAGDYREAA